MPTYVYRILRSPEQQFEVKQSINEAPLTRHPETGESVERVIFAPAIVTGKLGNASIASSGLTKYVKTSDGSYERQAGGGGPKVINPHEM